MADEKTKKDLLIREIYDTGKEAKGEMMWVARTDHGDYTGFGQALFEEIAEHEGSICEVVVETKGKYKNIKEFNGLAEGQDVPTEKVGSKAKPAKKSYANVEMLVSYAKDILIAFKEEADDVEKGMVEATKAVIKSYETISKKL